MRKRSAFYTGKRWRDLSYRLKVERGGKCERCGFTAITREDWARLIGHHKVEINDNNIDDASISLNSDNVEIICIDCHNKEHRHFGYQKHVSLVWGSPLSGKTTAVREMMRYGDIVLDVDRIWEAVTMQPAYMKPDNVRFNVFALRDALFEQIKRRYGEWYDAYIIGGYADKYERERVATSLGAEMIYVESTIEECLRRRETCGRPREWDTYIRQWWELYERYR